MHARSANRPISLPSLQAGRGFAALAVLFFHAGKLLALPKYGASHPFESWTISGILGVDFFFTLSGFIIFHAHAADIGAPQALPRYLWRRFARIYPIYWLYLCGMILILAFYGGLPPPGEIVRNIFLVGMPDRPIIYPAWSLFFEVIFYTLFALLILNRVLGAAAMLAWLLFTGSAIPGWPRELFDPIKFDFLLGALAWMGFQTLDPRRYPWFLTLGLTGLGAIVWYDHLRHSEGPHIPVVTALASALVICGLAMADRIGAYKVPKPLLLLGAASYTIYLTQLASLSMIAHAAGMIGASVPPVLSLAGLVAASALAGCALYLGVERPLLDALRHGKARAVRARGRPTKEGNGG